MDTTQRLDKFLSNSGYASRRSIKKFLRENTVTINGERARESGLRINVSKDDIRINNQKIKREGFVYYLLNKPKGIVSTSADEFDRKNVVDLVDTDVRVYPVGRLDKDTHGLILLTNDGELTHKLTHPKFHVPKTYLLKIEGKVSEGKLEKLRNGIILSDGLTNPAKVKVKKETPNTTELEMEIYEGRYRQIRRMCEAIHLNLIDLQRIKFGPIKIDKLRLEHYRELTESEIDSLKKATEKDTIN